MIISFLFKKIFSSISSYRMSPSQEYSQYVGLLFYSSLVSLAVLKVINLFDLHKYHHPLSPTTRSIIKWVVAYALWNFITIITNSSPRKIWRTNHIRANRGQLRIGDLISLPKLRTCPSWSHLKTFENIVISDRCVSLLQWDSRQTDFTLLVSKHLLVELKTSPRCVTTWLVSAQEILFLDFIGQKST